MAMPSLLEPINHTHRARHSIAKGWELESGSGAEHLCLTWVTELDWTWDTEEKGKHASRQAVLGARQCQNLYKLLLWIYRLLRQYSKPLHPPLCLPCLEDPIISVIRTRKLTGSLLASSRLYLYFTNFLFLFQDPIQNSTLPSADISSWSPLVCDRFLSLVPYISGGCSKVRLTVLGWGAGSHWKATPGFSGTWAGSLMLRPKDAVLLGSCDVRDYQVTLRVIKGSPELPWWYLRDHRGGGLIQSQLNAK